MKIWILSNNISTSTYRQTALTQGADYGIYSYLTHECTKSLKSRTFCNNSAERGRLSPFKIYLFTWIIYSFFQNIFSELGTTFIRVLKTVIGNVVLAGFILHNILTAYWKCLGFINLFKLDKFLILVVNCFSPIGDDARAKRRNIFSNC